VRETREIFVTELVKEVLGPRQGLAETIDASPLNEYITGVLAPLVARPAFDVEGEIPLGESGQYEEETGDVDVHAPPLLSPALDPKARPPSMGVSFLVESNDHPMVSVCLTWARYEHVNGGRWERHPRYFVQDISADSRRTIWIDSNGHQSARDQAEVSLHILPIRREQHVIHLSLYLVNRIVFGPENPDDLPRAEHHIFQPQIRVACQPGTRLIRSKAQSLATTEEARDLEFLYRNRPVFAHGHLCSATWKDIDPEREFPGSVEFPQKLRDSPFYWIDGEQLPADQRNRFSPAEVRTEFVPIYSIPSPEVGWQRSYGDPPEMAAAVLAESWSPDELRSRLEPTTSAYQKWISELKDNARQLSPEHQETAMRLAAGCEQVLERLRRGIDLLCADADARLAFCFANKALDLQWNWARRRGLIWRPFQLAFILMGIESIAIADSPYRNVCDLLWVPTGTGKTEAYLALVAFTSAYRRRRSLRRTSGNKTGAGVSVITRYTLRLLTIQQFRRALAVLTACEYLRIFGFRTGQAVGWRPAVCTLKDDFLWGSTAFSIGLWVGAGVTPNKLQDSWGGNRSIPGALSILQGRRDQGEPAQVLTCPACETMLAVPEMGLQAGRHRIHFVVQTDSSGLSNIENLRGSYDPFELLDVQVIQHKNTSYATLTLEITAPRKTTSADIDNFWRNLSRSLPRIRLAAARPSRPGYFLRWYTGKRGQSTTYDFEIFCPNHECPLHFSWCGGAPAGMLHGRTTSQVGRLSLPDGNLFIDVQDAFQDGSSTVADRIPIPAYTVDDQVYHRLPTVVIATVDKFARPSFEPRASGFFGNVQYHHCLAGYYRRYEHFLDNDSNGHPSPGNFLQVHRLDPPDLILQDELHLIEGPLGSLVGIYEAAVEFLCREAGNHRVKYVASTATVRRAEEQVGCLFTRNLQIFPPLGLDTDDRFFVRDSEIHPLKDDVPGRVYAGICSPGRGPLTPLIRIWTRLLNSAWNARNLPAIDGFWTVAGYFNAIRELAGARALYRQDIPERLSRISSGNPRPIPDDRCQELSSRTDSTDLPAILDLLTRGYPEAQDALFTTSMFGTGVDIPRISLMVVNGQPKTTSAYIQSTGRVGRNRGALVVTFLRASRPRDLNHYEFFCGYHRQLHRFVEPATVYPFAPGVLEGAGGPVSVFILRNMRATSADWHLNDAASIMAHQRSSSPEIRAILDGLEGRVALQPGPKSAAKSTVRHGLEATFDKWQHVAHNNQADLRYVEYAIANPPRYPVVLGDPPHQHAGLPVVYPNAPQSLRDIEETAGFET
jgi:hypothetical protein